MKNFTGQAVRLRLCHKGETSRTVEGKVIWQHPQGRFAVIEYEIQTLFGARRLRECVQIIRNRLDGAQLMRKETKS